MHSQKVELSADLASSSTARRFVDGALAQASEDVRANASLLISEVVTNALLHATGPVTVEVQQKGGAYRIAVGDRSTAAPAKKDYRVDDATGRGLQMLDLLAAAWGWNRTASGKIVWFDLPEPFDGALPSGAQYDSYEDPFPNGAAIALLGAPVQEMIRTNAHYDALYREFRLVSELDASHRRAVPGHLLRLIGVLGTSLMGFGRSVEETWDEAVRENRDRVDLHFRFPAEAGPGVKWYSQLLDEADDYCLRAELLTVAPTDEALAVRRWVFGQVAGQCQGDAPTPWSR